MNAIQSNGILKSEKHHLQKIKPHLRAKIAFSLDEIKMLQHPLNGLHACNEPGEIWLLHPVNPICRF